MADPRSHVASVTERVRLLEAGAPIAAIHFLGRGAAFVLAEEAVLHVPPEGEPRRINVHDGAILSSAADESRIVTGGDDGKVIANDGGGSQVVAVDPKKRWIDHVALATNGAVAWSAGKTIFLQTGTDEQRVLEVISTPGGLAFAPKGLRLAIAHYNGVSLWFPNAQTAPEFLEWKGSHHCVTFSPDGRFVVTAMQEPTLHGWRLENRQHMRMSGYAARVRSFAWSGDGRFLATGGSDQLILWPFHGKDGPMGKSPRLLAPHSARLGVVACHPKQGVVAAGFADGLVLLARIEDGAEILVRRPDGVPVSALSFSRDGGLLALGSENGQAGIVAL